MKKWEAKTETTNIGTLELGNLTFDEDYIQVSIDICDMSDDLKAEIQKAAEIEKVRYIKECEELNAKRGYNLPTVWSDKPVNIDYIYLSVTLEAGKPIEYNICFKFSDADNKRIECYNGSVTVDLSEYANELKKMIIKVLVDKFF